MESALHRALMTAALVATFVIALSTGLTMGTAWTFWGVVLSGLLWLLASLTPTWGAKDVAPAVLNSFAASAAVFAGLTALSAHDVARALLLLHR